jgi:hypothetical protein
MHKMVGHAIVPFAIGGAVHMYYFTKALPGTACVTMDLIAPDGSGPVPTTIGTFEFIAFTKHDVPPPRQDGAGEMTAFDRIERRLCGIFTDLGSYSLEAPLRPMETCELPGRKGRPVYLLLDEFAPIRGEFRIQERKHGLMLCMEIFPGELAFAQENGSSDLRQKLIDAGHYPYSDMDREPVV